MVRRGDALPATSVPDEEAAWLRQAEAGVRLTAQRLRRALNADRIDQAVKVAADLAAELRSPAASALSPKAYYDVYLAVAAELRVLENHISEMARLGAPVLSLYERVQETPLVLPRLYLLVCVGSVYVKSHQADPAEVLRDLVEMCAGVQHPQRGLFLRAYLLQTMKDKLPDVGSPFVKRRKKPAVSCQSDVVLRSSPASRPTSNAVLAGEEESSTDHRAWNDAESEEEDEEDAIKRCVSDSVDFVVRNFTEMNRLWVRSQQDVAPEEADVKRREQERREMCVLVGSNISTLAYLQGVDLNVYKSKVLPAVLDQIVTCHDAIAQEYLADCVAQVFPDEYQLATLDHFLVMCTQLVQGVSIKVILTSVIDRLTKYSLRSEVRAKHVQQSRAFETFRDHVQPVMHRQGSSLSIADRFYVYISLMEFTLKSNPGNLGHVDDVLGFAVHTAREIATGDVGLGGKSGSGDGRTSYRVSSGVTTVSSGVLSQTDGGLGMPKAYMDDYEGDLGSGGLDNVFSDEEEALAVRLLTLPLETYQDMSSALALTNYASLQAFLRYGTRRKMAVTLLQSVSMYKPCISKVALLNKLVDYVSSLAEDVPRSTESGNSQHGGVQSADGMFDVASLSPHHEFILASVPGAASFPVPGEKSNISIGAGVAHSEQNSGLPTSAGCREDEGASPEDEDSLGVDSPNYREFECGQELVSRIVYFCDVSDVSQAFLLYVALRDRLMRGGRGRVPITLPPLVLATLGLCTRAGIGAADFSMHNGLAAARTALHFAIETIDAMRSSSPDSSLRLYLQTAMTASAVYRQTIRVSAATEDMSSSTADVVDIVRSAPSVSPPSVAEPDPSKSSGSPALIPEGEAVGSGSISRGDCVQQYVYEGISRAFEVFETGVVGGKAQFTALELVIGALSVVCGSLEAGVYDALAMRTVKHAHRLLTRSDQCLALCACVNLFWQGEDSDIANAAGDLGIDACADDGTVRRPRSVGNVLICVNAALEAGRACVNDAERVLLLVDVGHCIARLVERGCIDAAADGRLDGVFGACATVLEGRRGRSSAVGRAATTRLHRLRKHVKSHPGLFGALALKLV